jgi:hypothetical protein
MVESSRTLMSQPAEIVKALLRAAFFLGVFALALVGLVVAWWLVLIALAGISAYLAIKRWFAGPRGRSHGARQHPGAPPRDAGAVVIEGEYRIEHDDGGSGAARDRGNAGRSE